MKPLELMEHPGPGKFLVFCGVDGTGKSTIVDRACQEITRRGAHVRMIKQPSPFIREFKPFRDHVEGRKREDYHYPAISMMAQADRVQLSAKAIGPAMAAGDTVISDRYVLSGLSRLILSGEKDTDWFSVTSRMMIKPTMTFLLYADPDVIQQRLAARTFESTSEQQFDEILALQRIMLRLAEANGAITIDTSRLQPDEAAAEVFSHLPAIGLPSGDQPCNIPIDQHRRML